MPARSLDIALAAVGDANPDSDDAAHGRAALLLVESLIHALIDKAVLTRGEVIDIVTIALDAEHELDRVSGRPAGSRGPSPLAPLVATFHHATGR